MRSTVPRAVSERPVDDKSIVPWANNEARPLLDQARRAANYFGTESPDCITEDATPVTIWSQVMRTDRAWRVEYVIQGYDIAGGNMARYHEAKSIKRGTGAPSVTATSTLEADYEDVAAWGFTFNDAADGTISIEVNGDGGTTVHWNAVVSVLETPRGV